MIEAAWIPFRLRSLHGPLCPDPHSYFQSICPIRIAVHAPGDPAGFRSVLLTVGYHEPVSVVCLSDLLHLAFYDQGLLSPLRGPPAPPGPAPGSPASYGQSPEGYIRPAASPYRSHGPAFPCKKRAGVPLPPPAAPLRKLPDRTQQRTASMAASQKNPWSAVRKRAIVSPSTSPPVAYSKGLLIFFSSLHVFKISLKHRI